MKIVPFPGCVIGHPVYLDSRPQGTARDASGRLLIEVPDTRKVKKSTVLVEVLFVAPDVEGVAPGDTAILETDFLGAELSLQDDESGEIENLIVVRTKYIIAVQTGAADDRPGLA